MKLISVDGRTVLQVRRPKEAEEGDAHAPYELRAESRDSVGAFAGENRSVHFLNADAFRAALAAFLERREGSAILRGTGDCELEFFRWNAKGDVGVRFAIGTQFLEGEAGRYSRIAISGNFQLPGEFAEEMAAGLSQLLDG